MGQHFDPLSILVFLLALSVHEACHALAAYKLGDDTARDEGRLTLNPIAHIDPLGALLFLFAGFGWAKPVPVNPAYFRHPKRDMALTALAGPASNLILAFLSYAIMVLAGPSLPGIFQAFLHAMIGVNTGLFAFNLLPIAPLDGSKIVHMFIPWRYELQYEGWMRQGPVILIALLLAEQILPFSPLSAWVFGVSRWVIESLFPLLTLGL